MYIHYSILKVYKNQCKTRTFYIIILLNSKKKKNLHFWILTMVVNASICFTFTLPYILHNRSINLINLNLLGEHNIVLNMRKIRSIITSFKYLLKKLHFRWKSFFLFCYISYTAIFGLSFHNGITNIWLCHWVVK